MQLIALLGSLLVFACKCGGHPLDFNRFEVHPHQEFRNTSSFSFSTLPRQDLDAIFTPQEGWSWLGGDSSASIRIRTTSQLRQTGDRTRMYETNVSYLWLFGDTLIGSLVQNGTRRNITSMPHSTLAKLTPFGSSPQFFDPPSSRGWFFPRYGSVPTSAYYWLIDGVQSERLDCLFVVAMVIQNTGQGFVQLGTDLIVIPNITEQFQKHPIHWKWNSTRVPFSGYVSENISCSWNEGLALEAGYLYMLGNCAQTARLARFTDDCAASLSLNDFGAMQFWSGSSDADEGWLHDWSQSKPLFSSTFSEGTLKYNRLIGWYVFLCQAFDSQIRIAFTGPQGRLTNGGGGKDGWIIEPIMTVPEFRRSNGSFSYAAKAHPELAPSEGNSSKLIFSYNTNVGPGINALVNQTWAYHPTFVLVNIFHNITKLR